MIDSTLRRSIPNPILVRVADRGVCSVVGSKNDEESTAGTGAVNWDALPTGKRVPPSAGYWAGERGVRGVEGKPVNFVGTLMPCDIVALGAAYRTSRRGSTGATDGCWNGPFPIGALAIFVEPVGYIAIPAGAAYLNWS